jgi:uncharacterized membrane protein
MHWFRKAGRRVPISIQENITTVAQLEDELQQRRSRLDRISDGVSTFAGSVGFIIAHIIAFAFWIFLNTPWLLGDRAFDPYPFVFLNLILAVEAVLLGTFVLMSQNRQNRQADHWAHLGLQISLLAEHESTKGLQMLVRICRHLGLHEVVQDKELLEMLGKTHIQMLAQELEQARETPTNGVSDLKQGVSELKQESPCC